MKVSKVLAVALLNLVCGGCGPLHIMGVIPLNGSEDHRLPCLTDIDANGTYLITVIGDSNSADDGHIDQLRTPWPQFAQSQNLLPQVHALLHGTETLEPLQWTDSALIGFSCVAPWGNPDFPTTGLAWTHQAIIHNADGIVLAVGTNDLVVRLATPEAIIDCYNSVRALAQSAKIQMFVATTPPIYPPWRNVNGDADYFNAKIGALNALVRSTFDPKIVIDFDTGFYDATLYLNGSGLHFNDAGQQLRAQRIVRVIKAAQA